MNGAESLLKTLVNGGIEVCFTNPGTSEMQFVAALDQAEGMRPVLGLFEGVCSGAADGYGRMADKPAATLLHLGPGLANGLANFHNAKRAHTPIINIVGEHATYHLQHDPPLNSDIIGYARPVSDWIRTAKDAQSLAMEGAAAIAAALEPPGRIATLIAPADCCWNEAEGPADAPTLPNRSTVAPEVVREVAMALRSGEPAVILMTGQALREKGLTLASRVASTSGARLLCDTFNARLQRGAGRAVIERLPYFAEQIIATLEGTRHLILVGSKPPVSFFAYPDKPSWLTPEGCRIHVLAQPADDAIGALEALADELGAPPTAAVLQPPISMELPRGVPLTPEAIATTVAALLPEGTIVSEEAITSGLGTLPITAGAAPHDWLFITGGAIGQGLPVATGAAVACPDRKVLCLQADGSAMYTLQALWTQAREQLDVTTVLYANRQYRILQIELQRVGVAGGPGPKARDMLDIGRPDLDWVKLASGMGVSASRATTIEEFNRQFQSAINGTGPHLIEVVL